MKSCLLAVLIILVNCQLPNEPLPKFALLTVTHARNNSYQTILNYLKHYTETECYQGLISQICIVWNNQQLPQNVGAMNRQLYWRMPVYFYLTKNNSLNHRFKIPKEASAELFYSLDDDILVDCNTLRLTYAHYMDQRQSAIKTIVTNEGRNYGFFAQRQRQFFYQGHSYASYFSIAQTGASFFAKNYLTLFYLNLQEINLLREKVNNITSCQDIFFMAIAQHFYPESLPKYYAPQQQYQNTNPSIGLSRKLGLVPLRTSCLRYLSEVFGYMPLRQFSKNASLYKDNWRFPNQNLIMQTKIQGFINITTIEPQQRTVDSQQPVKYHPEQKVNQLQQIQSQQEHIEQEIGERFKQQVIPSVQINITKNTSLLANQRQFLQEHNNKQKQHSDSLNSAGLSNTTPQWSNKFKIITFFLIIVITALILTICKLYRMYTELKTIRQHSSVSEEELGGVADEQF